MAEITLGGNAIHTNGNLPSPGSSLMNVRLVNTKLENINLTDLLGKKLVINIFPSVNTGVCAASMRKFNELASQLEDTRVINISMDLPFSLDQFCGSEGLENIESYSDFRFREFGDHYKCRIEDGKFAALLSRAIIVTDQDGKILHTEQVSEIAHEPDYDAVMAIIK